MVRMVGLRDEGVRVRDCSEEVEASASDDGAPGVRRRRDVVQMTNLQTRHVRVAERPSGQMLFAVRVRRDAHDAHYMVTCVV